MYLKRRYQKDQYHYILCESYIDGTCWRHRELTDLGPDPEQYVEYPGGNSFHIKESLEETLEGRGTGYSSAELEELFLPFIDPHIRRIVHQFQRPRKSKTPWSGLPPEELLKIQQKLHPFDKRRLHYLRCGRVHIGNLDGRPWKFLNVLLGKSRDEIETVIEYMEQALSPHEIRPYLYTAFEIQTYFRHHPARYQPAALDPEKVDHYFLRDLCWLNRDEKFFSGVDRGDHSSLHPYLVKYLILYFDNPFDAQTVWEEYVEDFRWRHQFYGRSGRRSDLSMPEQEACRSLGISPKNFEKMDRSELIRCYRRLAKKTHPDRGGDKEKFVKMQEAYECLLARKC